MTWEWSHTGEAYENAQLNLSEMPVRDLVVIAAEWRAAYRSGYDFELSEARYRREWRKISKQVYLGKQTADTLTEEIWPKVEELRSCTNGGWEAHVCPFGCGCHMVSFDRREEAV